MRAQYDVLIGLFLPANLSDNVMRYDRATHMIRNGISHHHLFAFSEQPRNALSIFSGYQKLRIFIDAFLEVADVAVQQLVRARGYKSDRHYTRLLGRLKQRPLPKIFFKQVIPSLHDVGMNQRDCTLEIACLLEIFSRAEADIHDPRSQRSRTGGRSPGQRGGMDPEFRWADDLYLRIPFHPGRTYLDGFRVYAISAGGLESIYAPLDSLLHGRRSRHPAADLVGQHAQVFLQGWCLLRFLYQFVGCSLGKETAGNHKEHQNCEISHGRD